ELALESRNERASGLGAFPLGDVAEYHDAAARSLFLLDRAVRGHFTTRDALVAKRTAADADADAFRHVGVANEHLDIVRDLSPNCSYQRHAVQRKGLQRLGIENSVGLCPVLGATLRRPDTENLFCRAIEEQKLPGMVRDDEPLSHAVHDAIENSRIVAHL